MRARRFALAAAATLFAVNLASAQETQAMDDDEIATGHHHSSPKEPRAKIGVKTWKQRINTVARRPLRHDIKWIDSRDRVSWGEEETWRGIRDERPMIARKTHGFKEKRGHLTRRERVTRISRGPIQGPGFDE